MRLLPGTRTSDNTIVTSSSGNSVTVIPTDQPFVLQAFCHKQTYLRIKDFWTQICKFKLTEYMATIYDFIDPICAIRVKKVRPVSSLALDAYAPALMQMQTDIRQAVCSLGEVSLAHGDTRVDNIGYDPEGARYVLYDYDSVKVHADISKVQADLNVFEKSLLYRGLS